MKKQDIETFTLYGEFGELESPDFVHIEKIASRSRLYDGNIRPHIHSDLFQLIHIEQGKALVTLEKTQLEMYAPCLLTLPPGTVHGFIFDPDTDGNVLTVAGSLLLHSSDTRSKTLFESFYQKPLIIALADDPAIAQAISQTLNNIALEHAWPRPSRTLMLEWQVQILLLQLHRILVASNRSKAETNPSYEVLNRFRTLIEGHYREHWDVLMYADRLGVTEHSLTRLCRQQLRKTPLEIIQQRLILEAERKLIYTVDPVSMVAYELGFSDPAYFTRLFKRKTGATPGAYRKSRKLIKEI